ncbi:MAG: hypothetical protein V7607_4124 [Solirubrobacteraceae bacterium]
MRAGAGLAAALMAAVLAVLGVCGAAHARTYQVYTCMTPDGRLLGPTIDFVPWPSSWTWGYVGPVPATLSDECSNHGVFEIGVRNRAWGGGQSVWARWDAAPGPR